MGKDLRKIVSFFHVLLFVRKICVTEKSWQKKASFLIFLTRIDGRFEKKIFVKIYFLQFQTTSSVFPVLLFFSRFKGIQF